MAADFFSNPKFGVASQGQIPEVNLSGTNALKKTPAATPATNATTTRGTKKTSFRYPLKMLDANTDYLQIKVLQFKSPGFNLEQFKQIPVNFDLQETSSIQKTTLSTIYLPIPASVSDSNSVTWGESTVGPLEGYGLGAGTEVLNKGISGILDMFRGAGTAGQSLLGDAKAQDAMQKYFAGAAVQAAGGNTTGLGVLTRATGAVLNNNQELLFQGPSLRSFSFTFDFAPRDAKESEEVKQIIRVFKQSMAAKKKGPTSVQGLFLSSPEVFELTYKSGSNPHKFLNRFKQCALTNIQINYNASGAYATYPDGTPVHMQMSLEFQELNPIYAEDYNNGIGRDGVGY